MKFLLIIVLLFICSCSDYMDYVVVASKFIGSDKTNYCNVTIYGNSYGRVSFVIHDCTYDVGDTLELVLKNR